MFYAQFVSEDKTNFLYAFAVVFLGAALVSEVVNKMTNKANSFS